MKRLLAACFLSPGLVFPAFAADPAGLPPAPLLPAADAWAGAYLRLDFGYVFESDATLRRTNVPAPFLEDYFAVRADRGLAFGGGVGYRFNAFFRMDATLEHRFNSDISAVYSPSGDPTIDREGAKAQLSATTGLINAYVDLGAWSGFTPYVGAGLGGSWLSFGDHSGTATVTPASPLWGTGICPAVGAGVTETCPSPAVTRKSRLNVAWALMAGTAISVTPNLQIDVGYRYLNHGDVKSASDFLGTAVEARQVDGHEFRVGLRYSLGEAPPPVYAKN